jgi:AraC family transcriptional regulator of adaptative response / DNA-3-methyladenine glycosylase II
VQCDFFKHAAAAERAGFRPCLRCRPELAPGSAPVDAVARLARAAAARIEAGALNDGSLDDLAAELSISTRQLRRAVEHAFGATPVELAQTRRLLLAKQLLTETVLPVAVVADASGFASLRRFNHLFSARYGLSPSSLRRGAENAKTDVLRLRLSYRPPLDWPELLGFLAGRGAASVEAARDDRYLRTVQIDKHRGWIAVGPRRGAEALDVELSPSLLPVLVPLLARLRALFDLDAQPLAIAEVLGSDPRLAPLLAATPGLRVPGAFDGFELALRAILGQQVTVKAATTLFGRFAQAYGESIETPFAELSHLSPQAARIAAAPLQDLIDLGLTQARARTIHGVAHAQIDGHLRLAPGLDAEAQLAVFRALPGIGDWTAAYVGMRALRLSDAFPYSDLALCKALGVTPREALRQSEAWRPWRSYAALHLWRSLKAGG